MSFIKHKYDFSLKRNVKMAEIQEKLELKRSDDSFLKHPMDFGFRCVFESQLDRNHYRGLKNGNGLVEVPLQSGRVGIYKVFSERYDYLFSDTGQKNFYFVFIKIKELDSL